MKRALVALAFALALFAAVLEAKPPTMTCDPGLVPECVAPTPPPSPTATATRTPTVVPPSPTPAPTSTPGAVDTTPPTVKILSPLSGAVVPAGALVVTVEADDNVGVAKVQYEHNGTVVGSKNVAPWVFVFQNVQPPASTVGARAFDAAGNQAYAEVNVTVVANFTPTPTPAPSPTPPPSTPEPTASPQPPTPMPSPQPTASPAPTSPPGQNDPILPQASVDVSFPLLTGQVRSVPAGGNLQAALDAAEPGDVVELQAGATFSGNFVVRAKTGSGAKVWIRSSRYAELGARGTRAKPADAPKMAKISTPNNSPPLAFAFGASNYYLTGLEITGTYAERTYNVNSLVWLGIDPATGNGATTLAQLPDQVVFDRVFIHGTPTGNYRRGITHNARAFAIVDSTVNEIHEVGADNQAIGAWNGTGPFLIQNNTLEAACENFMLGGADTAIQNNTPSDITIRQNHFFKPLRWKAGDPSYAGIGWSVKNLFELKHAQRVLIEGNVFENWWASGQAWSIAWTVRNQNGGNPWATVQDITFQNNILKNVDAGMNFLAEDSPTSGGGTSQHMRRFRIRSNVFDGLKGAVAFQLLGGPINLEILNNSVVVTGTVEAGQLSLAGSPDAVGLVIRDNVLPMGKYGPNGDNDGVCSVALNTYAPDRVYTGNAIFGPYPTSGAQSPSCFTSADPGNVFPANQDAVYVNRAGGDYHVKPSYVGKGADIDAVNQATAGVAQ